MKNEHRTDLQGLQDCWSQIQDFQFQAKMLYSFLKNINPHNQKYTTENKLRFLSHLRQVFIFYFSSHLKIPEKHSVFRGGQNGILA